MAFIGKDCFKGGFDIQLRIFEKQGHQFGGVHCRAATQSDYDVRRKSLHRGNALFDDSQRRVGGNSRLDMQFGAGFLQETFDFLDDAIFKHGSAAGDEEDALGAEILDGGQRASAGNDGTTVKF